MESGPAVYSIKKNKTNYFIIKKNEQFKIELNTEDNNFGVAYINQNQKENFPENLKEINFEEYGNYSIEMNQSENEYDYLIIKIEYNSYTYNGFIAMVTNKFEIEDFKH